MPKGSKHVPCARVMASRKSAAVSSSQWTESRPGATGDCAHAVDAKSTAMGSNDDLRTCPPGAGVRLIVANNWAAARFSTLRFEASALSIARQLQPVVRREVESSQRLTVC